MCIIQHYTSARAQAGTTKKLATDSQNCLTAANGLSHISCLKLSTEAYSNPGWKCLCIEPSHTSHPSSLHLREAVCVTSVCTCLVVAGQQTWKVGQIERKGETVRCEHACQPQLVCFGHGRVGWPRLVGVWGDGVCSGEMPTGTLGWEGIGRDLEMYLFMRLSQNSPEEFVFL